MPQSIPAGLTREHVLRALSDLDAGIDRSFGQPTGYELVHDGKRYPPKAVVGLACRYSIGRVLSPDEFSGGEVDERVIEEERKYRFEMLAQLKGKGGTLGVPPGVLRELGIYGGAQGIWEDKARTGPITKDGEGITVGVLHTGSSYADDLAEDCIIYHYPQTRRPAGRDHAEINATKAAGRLGLPFFVITYPTLHSNVRNVQVGWVESWDD
jgi:hypothetical protein